MDTFFTAFRSINFSRNKNVWYEHIKCANNVGDALSYSVSRISVCLSTYFVGFLLSEMSINNLFVARCWDIIFSTSHKQNTLNFLTLKQMVPTLWHANININKEDHVKSDIHFGLICTISLVGLWLISVRSFDHSKWPLSMASHS